MRDDGNGVRFAGVSYTSPVAGETVAQAMERHKELSHE